MYYDIHAHLDIVQNLPKVIDLCKKSNIIIIAQGVDPVSNKKVLEYTKEYENVQAALGIYPNDALNLDKEEFELELLEIKKNKDNIVAIGGKSVV